MVPSATGNVFTLYKASVPPMMRYLGSLKEVLKIGEAFCNHHGLEQGAFLANRLHSSMLPLVFQVQMCSNMAKLLAVRVAKMDIEELKDDEKTFPELYYRIDKSIDILKSIDPDSIDASDDRLIYVETPLTTFNLNVPEYVTLYALPNFFFHSTTAYAILRNQGVPLSKLDFAAFETSGSKINAE